MNATLARVVDAATIRWRPLVEADIEAVVALERAAHAAPWTAGNFRDALAAGYGVAYAGCALFLAIVLFSRRDFT